MIEMITAKRMIALTGLLAGLAVAGATAFAQTSTPTAPNQGGAMMGQGGMMPGMMMNPEMQQQMTRMMDACNQMMGSTQDKGGPSDKKG